MTSHVNSRLEEAGEEVLYAALAEARLRPLWKVPRETMPTSPRPVTKAWHWRRDTVLPLAVRAAELIELDSGVDRRALLFATPGLDGPAFTSTTVHAAVQYLKPGEWAPAHRHTPSAIHFVLAGSGAVATVEGRECTMEPGDLILNPSWAWHEYHNDGPEPAVWFDGLDLPLVDRLESVVFENFPQLRQQVAADGEPEPPRLSAGLRELSVPESSLAAPFRYAWARTDAALDSLRQLRGSPQVSVEFVQPLTGHPVLPAMACEMHRLYPGEEPPARRNTGTSIYVVFSGRGRTSVGDELFEWGQGDVFVVPSWTSVSHESETVADLFAISDRPLLQALGLYRVQAATAIDPVQS
jgi:gentisate 1,2-dioxygenase